MGKTKDASHQELMEVINSFDFGGKLEEVGIFGNGHIMRLTVLYFPQKPDRSAIFSRK